MRMVGVRARRLTTGIRRCLVLTALPAVGTLSALWLCAAELTPSEATYARAAWVLVPDEVSPVSEEFRQRIADATATVPKEVWRSLWAAGWRIQMAEFVTDAAPNLMGEQPRGWPAGLTWENTDAVNLPQQRIVVVAEKRRNRQGEVVPTWRAEGVFRHELGHAYDRVGGDRNPHRSAHPSFLAAYQADLQGLTEEDRKELAYYLQGRGAGRQEAFAEAFAILLGGGSDPTRRDRFVRAFPRVLAYVEKTLTEHATLTQTARQ